MVAGYAPFCSKKTPDVCFKVTHFEQYLKFPLKCKISDACKDLIYKLVNKSEIRLGKNGSAEIKAHPFFKGVNWLKIKEMKPPFIPELENEYDTKYFDEYNYIEPFVPPQDKVKRKRREPEYTGYTFKGEETDPTDILSVINMIQQKTIEVEKEKEQSKEKINVNEININEEIQENKRTEDSSNHNSNNLKEEKEEKAINSYCGNKINIINMNQTKNNSSTINAKKTKENPFIIQKSKTITKGKTPVITVKNTNHKINIITSKKNEKGNINNLQANKPKKRKTLLENFSSGIKKVFKRPTSQNEKKK